MGVDVVRARADRALVAAGQTRIAGLDRLAVARRGASFFCPATLALLPCCFCQRGGFLTGLGRRRRRDRVRSALGCRRPFGRACRGRSGFGLRRDRRFGHGLGGCSAADRVHGETLLRIGRRSGCMADRWAGSGRGAVADGSSGSASIRSSASRGLSGHARLDGDLVDHLAAHQRLQGAHQVRQVDPVHGGAVADGGLAGRVITLSGCASASRRTRFSSVPIARPSRPAPLRWS